MKQEMKYALIAKKGQYALILRGENMTQYAVVNGLDESTGSWDWTCCHYDFGGPAPLSKAGALFKALDYFRMRTEESYIPYGRMGELATLLKDGLIEDDEDEAYHYMIDTVELSDVEVAYLGLDAAKYKTMESGEDGDHTPLSCTEGDYGPADPWDAPGMSASDFI